MWADAQRDGRHAEYPPIFNTGAIHKSSLIPFLVPCCKAWLTLTARVPCNNAANIGKRKTRTQ